MVQDKGCFICIWAQAAFRHTCTHTHTHTHTHYRSWEELWRRRGPSVFSILAKTRSAVEGEVSWMSV